MFTAYCWTSWLNGGGGGGGRMERWGRGKVAEFTVLKENLANKNHCLGWNGTFRVAEVVFYFLLLFFFLPSPPQSGAPGYSRPFLNRLPFSSPNSSSLPSPWEPSKHRLLKAEPVGGALKEPLFPPPSQAEHLWAGEREREDQGNGHYVTGTVFFFLFPAFLSELLLP